MSIDRDPQVKHAYFAGTYQSGDEVLDLWIRHFKHGNLVPVERWAGQEQPSDTGVLLISFDLGSTEGELAQLIALPIPKVLYLPPGGYDYAARNIVRDCRRRLVIDAIKGNPIERKLYTTRLADFKRRLENLQVPDRPLYPRFDLGHDLRKGDGAFIATPFEADLGFEDGVTAALEGLELTVKNPRNEYKIRQKITDKIAAMIDDSVLLIPNMIHKPGTGFNPNVFYEMGYGQAKAKTVLPFRPRRDEPEAPIDIRDRDYIEYEDSVEVAMKLYWGLKDAVI